MVLCTISQFNTRMDMAANWQRDKKNSNHSLIEKNTEIIVFEPLRFILLLSTEIPCTAHKNAKSRWNKKIPYFFPGSVCQKIHLLNADYDKSRDTSQNARVADSYKLLVIPVFIFPNSSGMVWDHPTLHHPHHPTTTPSPTPPLCGVFLSIS